MIELNKIYTGDCIEVMKLMDDRSIDGVITSPPYNMTTERKDCYYDNGYAEIDNLPYDKYLLIRLNEFKEFSRILKDRGVICYNISYHKEYPILPLLLMAKVHEETDLTVADIIVWKKKHAIPFQTSPTKLSRICELIYVIVKKDFLHTYKANKEISKVNEKTGQKFYKNYNNIIYAANNDGFKSNLKAVFSQNLCDQLLNLYFEKGSIIYDPFCGIGTTLLSCKKNGYNYIGSELSKEFVDIAMNRSK